MIRGDDIRDQEWSERLSSPSKVRGIVLVLDRRTPVARIVPVGWALEHARHADNVDEDARIERWTRGRPVAPEFQESPGGAESTPFAREPGYWRPYSMNARRNGGRVPVNFWDTSASLLSGLTNRTGSACSGPRGRRPDGRGWGTTVEYVAAVSRREREGNLTTAEASELLDYLFAVVAGLVRSPADRRVRELAQRLLRVHPLRAADGLQLAAALAAAEEDPSSIRFVCFDARLNQAASREGSRFSRREPPL